MKFSTVHTRFRTVSNTVWILSLSEIEQAMCKHFNSASLVLAFRSQERESWSNDGQASQTLF